MSNPPLNPRPRAPWAVLGLSTWRGRTGWLVSLLGLAILVCWILAAATPPWYRPLDPADQSVIDASLRGQTLLYYDLRNAAERVPLGEQIWSISQDDFNAFLAVNTAAPLSPDATRAALDRARNPVSDPFVVFGDGEITVAARLTKIPSRNPQGGVGSATFSIRIVHGADGTPQALVELRHVRAGLLPVPQSLLQSRLESLVPALTDAAGRVAQLQMGIKDMDRAGPEIQQAVRGMVNGQPIPLHFKFDKKEFLVRDIDVKPGRFTLTLAPLKPATVAPRPPSP